MQKLRNAYLQTQNNAKNNFDKVTFQRAKQLHAYANKQYDTMGAQGDYTNFDELVFYQQKFRIMVDIYTAAINDKTKKSKLQADMIALLSDNFGQANPIQQTPQYIKQQPKPQYIKQEPDKGQKLEQEGQKGSKLNNLDPKESLNIFFDTKKNEIEKNRIGFQSVLESMPKASQKYPIKSNFQSRINNDDQILKLNSQIGTLSKKIQETKMATDFNKGLYQAQKQDYESRIKDLVSQIQILSRQNEKMKQSSSINNYHPPAPVPVETKVIYEYRNINVPEIYSPHTIRYRENDLIKIRGKSPQEPQQLIERSTSPKPRVKIFPVPALSPKASLHAVQPIQPIQFMRKNSQEEILIRAFPNQKIQLVPPAKYQEEFQRSGLRFNRSQAENEDKNIAIRSKLSFFKPQVVLYRGQQFEVAVKSFSLVNLETIKIYIFVNNKDKFNRNADITYNYDPNYFEVKVVRKLNEIQGFRQSKQEVHVKLKDKTDLDTMIQAKLKFSDTHKEIKFLVPSMFLQFSNIKHQNYAQGLYQRNTITPIYQFSSIFSAMEIIPFDKSYEENVEVASVFARSKHHQGYIQLRWKAKGEVQINTIKPWKLFINYLISKEY